MKVRIKKLHPDAVIPKYATSGASGFDLHALEEVTISPGETKLVKTGLAFDVGSGYELQIRPRSGLSLKTRLRVANAPGTVDADFRGEVCVIMENTEDVFYAEQIPSAIGTKTLFVPYVIKKGDRIAQGVVCPVVHSPEFEVVDNLDDTVRGSGGFGSTGV